MSVVMEEEIKHWTVPQKLAMALESIQGKTTVAKANRQFDVPPSEIEDWIDQGKVGMGNALWAKPEDVREYYERQLKDLQKPMTKRYWICTPEKSGSVGQRRDLMGAIQ